jgi:nucleoside-diphosphate-sugar epimerase
MYGAYKAAIEAHLWADHFATGRHTAAIRPCGVYGLDPKLERTHGYNIVKKLTNGQRFDKQGGGKFVHVDDVAAATVAAVSTPDAAGRPFNLVDCYARWGDWAAMAAEVLGVGAEIDLSSPAEPKNTFLKDATRDVLGVPLERGHAGIRASLEELVKAMNAQ